MRMIFPLFLVLRLCSLASNCHTAPTLRRSSLPTPHYQNPESFSSPPANLPWPPELDTRSQQGSFNFPEYPLVPELTPDQETKRVRYEHVFFNPLEQRAMDFISIDHMDKDLDLNSAIKQYPPVDSLFVSPDNESRLLHVPSSFMDGMSDNPFSLMDLESNPLYSDSKRGYDALRNGPLLEVAGLRLIPQNPYPNTPSRFHAATNPLNHAFPSSESELSLLNAKSQPTRIKYYDAIFAKYLKQAQDTRDHGMKPKKHVHFHNLREKPSIVDNAPVNAKDAHPEAVHGDTVVSLDWLLGLTAGFMQPGSANSRK